MNPYDILGIPRNSSKDIVKKKYREIALSCHPDKLTNINDEQEKSKKIQKFKEVSIAYDIIINDKYYEDQEVSFTDWNDIWSTFFDQDNTSDILKDVFFDVADSFINNNIKSKSYYNPKKGEKHLHEMNLHVSFSEVRNNTKKKLRLILTDIDEPVFVDIYCGSYPRVIKEYIGDDDIEHEIIINMRFKDQENFEYICNQNDSVDLITSINISLYDYLVGCSKEICYIDGQSLTVDICKFENNYVKLDGYGLNGGILYVNLIIEAIEKKKWELLCDVDKSNMVRITKLLSKTI